MKILPIPAHTGHALGNQMKPHGTNLWYVCYCLLGGIATQHRYFEGSKIYPVAVVVSEYSFVASHYSAVKSLSQWLEE